MEDNQSKVETASNPLKELIERFYAAFQKKDHVGMGECYHDEIVFSDPMFPLLEGWKAKAMWHMLCTRAKDLTLEVSNVVADPEKNTGSAHWEAKYTFQGNKVLNKIDATFQFKDGKIIKHVDKFDFYTWSSQALGITGLLLGWTPFVQNASRNKTAGLLKDFIEKNNLDPNASKSKEGKSEEAST